LHETTLLYRGASIQTPGILVAAHTETIVRIENASQINGGGFRTTRDARKQGETEQRLFLLNA
jgi:hypothetical protein